MLNRIFEWMTKEAGKKVPFLWNAERRRSIWDWLCPAFLNAMLLNRSIQDLIQIYGQSLRFCRFVRKQNAFYGQTGIFQWFVRKFLPIMMKIYGQKPFFGAFVRKTGSETVHFHRCVRNFAKCSACSIITPSSQSNLPPNYFGLFSSWKWKASCIRKNRMICNYLQIIRFFNLRQSFFPASFCIFRSLDVLQ